MHYSRSSLTELERFCVDRWEHYHQHYNIIFHTDNDIRNLLLKYYPDIVDVFDQSPGIVKGQIGRYLVMITHGGTYADVDVCPFTCLDNWIEPEDELISVRRGDNDYEMDYQFHSIKGHPIWEEVLLDGVKLWSEHTKVFDDIDSYRHCIFETLSVHHLQKHYNNHLRRTMEAPLCSSYEHHWGNDECYTTHFSSESWLPKENNRYKSGTDEGEYKKAADHFMRRINDLIPK